MVSDYADMSGTRVNGLSSSTTYYFRVKAHNGIGDSDYSNVVETETTLAPPTDLAALAISTGEINLTWTDSHVTSAFPTLTQYSLATDLTTPVVVHTFDQNADGSTLHVKDDTEVSAQLAVGYGASDLGNNYIITGNVTYINSTTELGFLARGNMAGTEGYVLSLEPHSTNSYFSLLKLNASSSPLSFTSLQSHTLTNLDFHPGDTYTMSFELRNRVKIT